MSSELEDVPQPETHGKAHHTPASRAAEAPDQEPAQKQMRLPASAEPAIDGRHSMSSADVAAIEALMGAPLAEAIDTAVREESLWEENEQINAREEDAAASVAAKRANRAKQSAPTEPQPPAERRSAREGAGKIELFSQSEHATWSDYEQARLIAGDHVPVRDISYDELRKQCDAAVATLEVLSAAAKRDRAALVEVYDNIKSTFDGDDLGENMARVAAITVQSALCEMLSPQQLEGVANSTWSGAADYQGKAGTLSVSDGLLRWVPAQGAVVAVGTDSIIDVDNDTFPFLAVSTAGADYRFSFGAAGRLGGEAYAALDAAEQTLHAAIAAGRFQKEAKVALVAEAEQARAERAAREQCAAATQQQSAAAPAAPKPTKRVRQGLELREALKAVSKLQQAHKVHEAEAQLAILRLSGDAAKDGLVKKRAQELRTLLFTFGSFNQTKAICEQFVSLPEVSIALGKPKQTRRQVADAQTGPVLLEMTKGFLNDILKAKGEVIFSKRHNKEVQSGGRRTDDHRNAYYSALTSHIPRDIFKTRQGRAAIRCLGVPYRMIKACAGMRARIEDSAKGWCYLSTAQHCDRVDVQVYRDAWHSELLSTEDNVHKELITVYCGTCEEQDGTTTQQYTQHWRRAQVGTEKDCLAAFNTSEFAAQLKEATKTAKLPEGRKGNLQDLRLAKCNCVKLRGTAECDCKICSVFEKNLKTYNSKRYGWRNSMRKDGDQLVRPPPCTCLICRDDARKQQFYQFSRSVSAAASILHPCGKMEYEPYAIGGGKFYYFNGMCMAGKCPKRDVFNASNVGVSCGWDFVFGAKDCLLEATDDNYTWWAWKPQLRGTSSEGKPYYSDEIVPVHGTRAQGLQVLRANAAAYFPHFWKHVLLQRGIACHEANKDAVTATRRADYAAQIKTLRFSSATCAHPETHNMLVAVMGYLPEEHTVTVKKHGKRPASTKTVRKQQVDVYYVFHPSSYKPDARSYNVACENIDYFMKNGSFLSGEWFHKGARLPCARKAPPNGSDASLPSSINEAEPAPPVFPHYSRVTDITDTCAAQFDGRDNYHQIAEWPTKLDILRLFVFLVSMHGKNICDALSNSIAAALRRAVEVGDIIDPTTRKLVLYLVEHYQEPATAKMKKDGWWAVSNIYYGFLDPSFFTRVAVTPAEPLKGSDGFRRYIGRSKHHNALRDGPLELSPHFCGCVNCCKYDFEHCLMDGKGGFATKLVQGWCKRADTNAGLPSLSTELEVFAKTQVDAFSIGVVPADVKEQHIEGGYWLCLIKCKPYLATRKEACATDVIEEGWWVVKIQWYAHVQQVVPGTQRHYKLDDGERLLAVNALLRISGVRFENKQRESRSANKVLGHETHKNIQDCLPFVTVGVNVRGPVQA